MQKTVLQYFASLGEEHYREGMFKLVKWDKNLNANSDYVGKKINISYESSVYHVLARGISCSWVCD
jgi:hypothetical protein